MAKRRRKVGFLTTLFRALNRQHKVAKRTRATQRRIAQKKAAAHQKTITAQSTMTAGELRKTGKFTWAGDGMPDSTVMKPVRTMDGWEWVPVARQPRKVAQGAQPKPETVVIRHEVVHSYEQSPTVAEHQPQGWTTIGELRQQGHGDSINPNAHDNQTILVNPWIQATAETGLRPDSQRCGAPTEDKTPCERMGNCPVPAHKRWRRANGRG